MAAIVRLVYLSKSCAPFSDRDLGALGRKSGAKNASANVTGMLLYSGGYFIQCLEGPSVAVLQIYGAISRDHRHSDIKTLVLEPAKSRLFPRWWMGVLNLDRTNAELDRARLLEVIERAKQSPNGRGPTDVVKLLKEFRSQLPAPRARASAA